MDAVVLSVLVGGFALLATAQVALVLALVRRPRPWRALVAFFVPPLAPFLGWESGFRIWPAIWLVALLLYAVALMAALL
ncbi:MAG: hypothetical protein JW751_11590 [Polyangiaceae bacterium]|nr:hypothetical protein [Polyangiaceae bacterium]